MERRTFISVDEVANQLVISKSYAYKLVKQLNIELNKMGILTVSGKVRESFFRK